MAGGVGERLLRDAVEHERRPRRHVGRVDPQTGGERHTGRLGGANERREPGEVRLGLGLDRPVLVAQDAEDRPDLGERLPRRTLDRRELTHDGGVVDAVAQRGALGLDDDHRHVVRDDVVQLACDPAPLLDDRPPRPLGLDLVLLDGDRAAGDDEPAHEEGDPHDERLTECPGLEAVGHRHEHEHAGGGDDDRHLAPAAPQPDGDDRREEYEELDDRPRHRRHLGPGGDDRPPEHRRGGRDPPGDERGPPEQHQRHGLTEREHREQRGGGVVPGTDRRPADDEHRQGEQAERDIGVAGHGPRRTHEGSSEGTQQAGGARGHPAGRSPAGSHHSSSDHASNPREPTAPRRHTTG